LTALALLSISCDKNKELVQFTTLYHIENEDTISILSIPNSFTPNGDGINDIYHIQHFQGINQLTACVKILESGGNIIVDATDFYPGWDGTYLGLAAQSGSYTLQISVADTTGYVFDYRGVIYLIR